MRTWVYLVWLLYNGEWDCVSSEDLNPSDASLKLQELTKTYGAPDTALTRGGETVAFTWKDGESAKVELKQNPCP